MACHAAQTGGGYWTCDVPGGCADCRRLAREVDDTEQLATWSAEKKKWEATGKVWCREHGSNCPVLPLHY